ncbi:hypothetical protein MKW98_016187 [Papaver atlanticum]|uniref:Uncharacterized protein n=1 Tax=Papaver atlanticum TaxID=357466 RepID=A0AAD4SGQ6_9MAGN|nr:hypothetical protein MKW98_016187 [Papaver atlanticum]
MSGCCFSKDVATWHFLHSTDLTVIVATSSDSGAFADWVNYSSSIALGADGSSGGAGGRGHNNGGGNSGRVWRPINYTLPAIQNEWVWCYTPSYYNWVYSIMAKSTNPS